MLLMLRKAVCRFSVLVVGARLVLSSTEAAVDISKLPPPAPQPVDFVKDIQPILAKQCYSCHGPEKQKADLRWDDKASAFGKGEHGPHLVVGKSAESRVIHLVAGLEPDSIMPPKGEPLTAEQIGLLRAWIDQGANWPESSESPEARKRNHWAFKAPGRPALPEVRDAAWPRNDIDRFVLARLDKESLKPSAPADKFTLVRRVYLDLIGLPPKPAEADAFVSDGSANAYEKLVDKLLASPHYGERWARRWLDLARYADTNGYEKDKPRSMWPWRDWVIKALNDDLPFDEFTVEQIAGDMLPNATPAQVIATGFNRNTMINEEGGIDPLEYRFYAMVDRVHVTSTAWLGLTMACAQCHSHKYDPISQVEYYRFLAALNNADEPTIDVIKPDVVEQRGKAEEKIRTLEAALPEKFPVELRAEWRTPAVAEFASTNGAEAELLSDGSFRVGGKSPEKDVYTVKFAAPLEQVTHVQLEAIPDSAGAKGGPGRNESGNFVVTDFELEIKEAGEKGKPRKIKFATAEADFAQEGYPVKNAIDGNADTGWAIAGPNGAHEHRRAIFALAEPLELKKRTTVTIRIAQNHGKELTLGRFRLSLGRELPELAVTPERRRVVRDEKFAKWLEAEARTAVRWQTLRPAEARSTSPFLTVEADDSVFAAGDFTKNDTYTLKFRNLPAGTKAIRLEMLPDDRLPMRGPGSVSYEGPKGDFWLSTFKVFADGKSVALTNATEDFANDKNTAARAIDDDLQSGWSINGGQGKRHNAVFQFVEALTNASELELKLTCEKYYAAGLGRFRVAITSDEKATATALDDESIALLLKYRGMSAQKRLLATAPADVASPRRRLESPRAADANSQRISQAGLKPMRAPAKSAEAADREKLLTQFLRVTPAMASARREIDKLRNEMPALPTTLVMRERPAGHDRATFRQHRGEFLQPKETVVAGVPSVLLPPAKSEPTNRLALARWLVSRDNPLTARVVINRQWEAFFGRGLVRTMEDFGLQGERPSHPELLDWLAVEFMSRGWSLKQMHKLIVMSATYQQASETTAELRERDPLNVLLARGPRFRLEAEQVRDASLVASGLFTEKLGGPSVYPPQPAGVTTEGTYGALEWKTSTGPDRYRRGLYTFAKRTAPFAMAATFDGPSGEACLARRERSNTPLQALTLLNDEVFLECARALGRVIAESPGDVNAKLAALFRRCVTRPPTAAELEKLKRFYESQLGRLASGELKAADILPAEKGEGSNEQAAWTAVARVLLNLDETITKG